MIEIEDYAHNEDEAVWITRGHQDKMEFFVALMDYIKPDMDSYFPDDFSPAMHKYALFEALDPEEHDGVDRQFKLVDSFHPRAEPITIIFEVWKDQ